jgi:hypothetical protein
MRKLPALQFQAVEPIGQSESGCLDCKTVGRMLNWLAVHLNSVKMVNVRNMRVAARTQANVAQR